MTAIELDIRSIPEMLRRTHARIEDWRDAVAPLLQGPIAFLGSGSSYCLALAMAAFYEQELLTAGQAIIPSDYLPRPSQETSVSRPTGLEKVLFSRSLYDSPWLGTSR